MLLNKQAVKKIGDCEIRDEHKDVEVFLEAGNIWMCQICRDYEAELTERNALARKMIQESRSVDSSIQLKQDIFTAKTVPAIELRAAIEHDDSIPADQKDYAFTKECMTRFQNLQKIIFEERKALSEKENELRMWQVNVQTSAGKLRSDIRAEFKQLDVNYQPTPVKSIKPKAVKQPSKKAFDKKALYEAAKKYDVPALQVQSIIVSRNMDANAAAKYLAELLGKI